jgi:hypothetical protein
MYTLRFTATIVLAFSTTLNAAPATSAAQLSLPRAANGKPNLQGIWQAATTAGDDLQDHVASLDITAGRSVLTDASAIPYQPSAVRQREENFRNRAKLDPLNKCYIPGIPRVMTLDYPFQIFQTAGNITMAFEWELDYRNIYLDGSKHHEKDDDSWMGDSRGRWEGDTLVVDVANMNGNTWIDKAGDFHSGDFHVVERYRMTDPNTIHYEATLEDPKVYTKPFSIAFDFHRRLDRDRLFEYVCEAEAEEANGAFTREEKTWYPGIPSAPSLEVPASTYVSPPVAPVASLRRNHDGRPDLNGFFESQARGANQGLERRGRGGSIIVDPSDGKLPMQPWAMEERVRRNLPERGYDDPTAHCFPPGVPRALWIPEGFQITQTPDYVVMLFERTAWRIIPLDGRKHLPDYMRLWEGDSVGHWEGDTLVVDTANFSGKTWLNEGGEIVSHAEHVIERFTPIGSDQLRYEATVNDPVVYDKPWTVSFAIKRENFELREAACWEEEHDLPHLKALKDGAAAQRK